MPLLRPLPAGNALPAILRRMGLLLLSEDLAAAVDAGAGGQQHSRGCLPAGTAAFPELAAKACVALQPRCSNAGRAASCLADRLVSAAAKLTPLYHALLSLCSHACPFYPSPSRHRLAER